MKHRPRHHFSTIASKERLSNPFYFYAFLIFLLGTGDAVMSFSSPLYIRQYVPNVQTMGLVISFSSVIGVICDFVFSKLFIHNRFSFFFRLLLAAAIAFPISLIFLTPSILPFLLGMSVWGIYYELMQFSNFSFINSQVIRPLFSSAWGVLTSIKAAAYTLGPILAGWALTHGSRTPFITAAVFSFLTFFCFIIAIRIFPGWRVHTVNADQSSSFSFSQQLIIWKLLMAKIWPVYILLFLISIMDAVFWTIGPLFAGELKQSHFMGTFFLSAYIFPSIASGFIISRFKIAVTDYKMIYFCVCAAAVLLILSGFIASVPLVVLTVLSASAFLSISFPLTSSLFENYVRRLGHTSTSMIGLQSSAISLSYIFGPIIAVLISSRAGSQLTFSWVAAGLLLYSLLAFFFTPKHTFLPETALRAVEEN